MKFWSYELIRGESERIKMNPARNNENPFVGLAFKLEVNESMAIELEDTVIKYYDIIR